MTEQEPIMRFVLEDSVQKPTVGRIVHYTHAHATGHELSGYPDPYPEVDINTHAAIVLDVPNYPGEENYAVLHVLPKLVRKIAPENGVEIYSEKLETPPEPAMSWGRGIPFSETPKPGHWSWPPR